MLPQHVGDVKAASRTRPTSDNRPTMAEPGSGYCIGCGAGLEAAHRYCWRCGAPRWSPEPEPPAAGAPPVEADGAAAPPRPPPPPMPGTAVFTGRPAPAPAPPPRPNLGLLPRVYAARARLFLIEATEGLARPGEHTPE